MYTLSRAVAVHGARRLLVVNSFEQLFWQSAWSAATNLLLTMLQSAQPYGLEQASLIVKLLQQYFKKYAFMAETRPFSCDAMPTSNPCDSSLNNCTRS